ncbi:MAG TPA: hypothetical protein VM328_06430 [Fimbriimonadaceae bacterium]|nr:hypothetical protein [Fimbriimonadaceae bacterium]
MRSELSRFVMGGVALLLAVQAAAQSTLTGVQPRKTDGQVEVQILGKDLKQPRTFRANKNRSLLVEFDANLAGKGRYQSVKDGWLRYVTYSWYKPSPPKVRVHLVLNDPNVKPTFTKNDQGWLVSLKPAATAVKAVKPQVAKAQFPDALPPLEPAPKAATVVAISEEPEQEKEAKPPVKTEKIDFPTSVPPLDPAPKKAPLIAESIAPGKEPFPKTPAEIHAFKQEPPKSGGKASAFPEKVPPLHEQKQTKPAPTPPKNRPVMVSLDFVNTEIVQILKALAMQAKVNIVTAPEVTGKLTVSLDAVSVEQALDFVTAMSGVRYAKVGNTFFVTTAAKFSETLQQINGDVDESSETRVVNIFSGEGKQIKAAVLKTIPPSTLQGRYDLVLPSDKVSVEQTTELQPTGEGEKSVAAGSGSTTLETKTNDDKTKKDDYVVVVGAPGRLQEVETMIRGIDRQICQALGVKIPAHSGVVQRMYEPRGVPAEDLLKTLKADPTLNFGNVQLVATPKTSLSRQVVVISGRENDVDKVFTMLNNLDQSADSGPTRYEIVSLRYITPQNAMVDLLSAVPGLRVNLLPPPIDPMRGIEYDAKAISGSGLGKEGEGASQGPGSGGSGGGGESQGPGNDRPMTVSAETKTFATPMKLMLHGTADQIARAHAHLQMIDMAPRQFAMELRVMNLTREDALKVGLDWNLLTGGTVRSIRINQGVGSPSSAGGVGANFGFAGGGSLDIAGMLDQISNRGNLIARPNLLLSDGRMGTLFVGDEVRYVEQIQATQNGISVVTGQVNVGVAMQVTGRVGDDGNIALVLMPESSILRGFTPIPGGGNLPQTSSRRSTLHVNMKSGETLALGGLIQEEDRRNVAGIPILKDLPIVGYLFKRVENSKLRTEVVFFLTVREVTEADRQNAANPRENERIRPRDGQ